MRIRLLLCLISFGSCKPSDKVVNITNVEVDTSFVIPHSFNSGTPIRIVWSAVGSIDDSAAVIFRPPNSKDPVTWLMYKLPKGKLSLSIIQADYYAGEVEVIYKHQNVKKGNLTITLKDW